MLLRLPLEVRDLFREWLMANFPDRYRHVFKLVRETRGGKDYDSNWGKRMTGAGPIAWMIGRRFEFACEKLGFNKARTRLTTDGISIRRAKARSSFSCSDAVRLVCRTLALSSCPVPSLLRTHVPHSSWPGLSGHPRLSSKTKQDVDARDEPAHDVEAAAGNHRK